MRLLISWLITSVAVYGTAAALPGFHVKDFKSAMIVAAIFGLLTLFVGHVLFFVFAVATLGIAWLLGFITWWVINTLLLMLTDRITDHLKIDSLGQAILGAAIIAVISTVLWRVLPGV